MVSTCSEIGTSVRDAADVQARTERAKRRLQAIWDGCRLVRELYGTYERHFLIHLVRRVFS